MRVRVHHTPRLQGVITPPPSKSQSIRAMIFNYLSGGKSAINNLLQAQDTKDCLHALNSLNRDDKKIYTGNSGITAHFILTLLGLKPGEHSFDCGDQMRARPLSSLIQSLRDLGMEIDSDTPPLTVRGKLKGGETTVDGLSSQPLSALLISLPCAEEDSLIRVENLHERSYVEMTISWLIRLGIRFEHHREGNQDIFIIPGKQSYPRFDYTVPSDYSSLSTFTAAQKLIPGEIIIHHLIEDNTQADQTLSSLLNLNERIDANLTPDLLPILSVAATAAKNKTVIFNASHARTKETDRIKSMIDGLTRMGAKISELTDGLVVEPSKLKGTRVKGYGDHRTVMALTLAGLLAEGTTEIEDADSVEKTYPQFFNDLITLGAKLELIHE